MKSKKKWLGTTLIGVMIVLMVLSIVMIASVSFPRAQKEYNNNYFFVIRQMLWIGIGIIGFICTSIFKYTNYRKMSYLLYIIGLIGLVAVLIVGTEVNGARRWLDLKVVTIQPSEFVKIILIIVISSIIYSSKNIKRRRKKQFLVSTILLTGIYALLILFEKSFSSTAQVVLIVLTLLFIAGIKKTHFFIIIGVIGALGVASIVTVPYRLKRILGFSQNGSGIYQVNQSLIAIGSGGLFGKHYGNGLQKYFFLPEIHTDYIFSGYAEEMGFVFSLGLILLYGLLLFVIMITIRKIKDMYAKYILIGILTMFSTQIIGNIFVALDLMPPTGIPLPIMSYGGSTTVVSITALGIVYNIIKELYRQEVLEEMEKK